MKCLVLFYSVFAFATGESAEVVDKECSSNICDLEPWLEETRLWVGYYVLCVEAAAKIHVHSWPGGSIYSRKKSIVFLEEEISSIEEFRIRMETFLKLEPRDKDIDVNINNFKPQKWALFSSKGDRVRQFANLLEGGVFLIFTGGQWLWPGIRKGYRRKLLVRDRKIELITMQLEPLLFQIDDFLTTDECDHLVESSQKLRSRPSNVSLMDKGLQIQPKKGRIIMFYNLGPDGSGDPFSVHAGCNVTSGVKMAANKWIWSTRQIFIRPESENLSRSFSYFGGW